MDNNIEQDIKWLLDEKYEGKRTVEAEKDIARLEKGEHLDYVIGWVTFLDCKIDLAEKPLIPRPETEYWIEQALQEIKERGDAKCLDIFAGSGCIGVAVLKHTDVSVDFAEKDEKSLQQIRINTELNKVDHERYEIIQSDVFSGVKGEYDFILANPPYVAEERIDQVQESVLEQEPVSAVFGGKDGLEYTRKFLEQAKKYLVPGGVVYLEFDSSQKDEIVKLAKQFGASDVVPYKDQYEKWRYARIVF